MVKHELPVASYKLRVETLKERVKFKNASSNPSIKSSSPRIIKSMKIHVNSRKSSSFPKIKSPKLFGNLWGNSYVQFLVKIFCFTFQLLHG